jgi:hypothetical protein
MTQTKCKIKNDQPEMKGCRGANQNNRLRRTRGDKHVGTVEKQYGIDLGMRSDTHLQTALQRFGVQSQKQLIKKIKNS